MSTPKRKTVEHHLLRALANRWRMHLSSSEQREFAHFFMSVLADTLRRIDDREPSDTGKRP